MSDRRYASVLGAALLTAGAATLAVYRVLSAAGTPEREPTRSVIVVARDVPGGAVIPREALAAVAWPARVAPPGSFVALDSVAGRVARASLARGEPVLAAALAPRGTPPGLEGAIAPGRRAMAVKVHEAAAVSGLVRTGSRVDVLVADRDGASGVPGAAPAARLLMRDVRVLGVGTVRGPDSSRVDAAAYSASTVASIVTLELTPAQAEGLAAAEARGTVQVVLRGYATGVEPEVPVAPTAPDPRADPRPDPLGGPASVATSGATPRARADLPAVARAPRARSAPVGPVAARPAAATSGQVPAAAPAAGAAPGADTAVVRVYRGGQLTVVRVEPSAAGRGS